jgi:diguanylate cyclase (GGDEF)-like protein
MTTTSAHLPQEAREPDVRRTGATALSRVEFTEQVRGALATEPTGSILYIDVDHLARVNYIWGFEKGDEALRRLITLLLAASQKELLGRFGGEEFVVYTPQGSDAQRLGEEIRSQVELDEMLTDIRAATPGHATATAKEHVSSGPFLTVSIGVAYAMPGRSFEEVLQAAHEAQSAAKALGRNRVVVG